VIPLPILTVAPFVEDWHLPVGASAASLCVASGLDSQPRAELIVK
jgi:hypothetical protein